MKQTLEEAAREKIHAHYNCNGEYPCGERDYCEHCNGHNTAFDCCECGADEFKEGFISGAEWQAKQSPWIRAKDQLPPVDEEDISEQSEPVLVKISGHCEPEILVYNKYYHVWDTSDSDDYSCNISDDDLWMPIPSFDEILEANKDVLERIKEKGD